MKINHPFLLTMTETGEGGGSGDGSAAGTGTEPGAGEGGNGNYTPPATQADLDRIVQARLERQASKYADYDDLKARVTEFEQSGLSEVEKLTKQLSDATGTAESATSELKQLRVALNHGFVVQDDKGNFAIDQDAVSLLGTGSEDDLEARAKTIAALRKDKQEQAPGFSHGPRGSAPASSMNDLLFGRKQ